MKSVLYVMLLLSVFIISSCNNTTPVVFEDDMIYLQFKNVSDYVIGDLVVEDIEYGKVRRNEKGDYKDFQSITMMGNLVMLSYSAKVKGERIDVKDGLGFCGMGLSALEAGVYTVEVDYQEYEDGGWLDFRIME